MMIPQETIDNAYDGLQDAVAEVLSDYKFTYPYASELEVVDWFGDEVSDRMRLSTFIEEVFDKIIDLLECEDK